MPRAARREAYGPAGHRRMEWTDRARPAVRDRPGGTEGAAAVTRRGLPGSADDVEWRRSPRSSSDPNMGSWPGCRPAGYEVGEGTPRRAELYLGTHRCQHAGEGTTTSTE